jgi:hypothetical protein
MDSILSVLNDPSAQGSIYVTAILIAMQLLKDDFVPAAWWVSHEALFRLVPIVLGLLAHWAIDSGSLAEIAKAGFTDGVLALGIFNGSKIIRG